MNLKLALLAGGKASRLLPLTESIPKSLIQISGKPFINWQLELIKSWNIQDVIICVGIHADQIIDYV